MMFGYGRGKWLGVGVLIGASVWGSFITRPVKSEALLPTLGEPQRTVQAAIDAYNRHDAAGFLTEYGPMWKPAAPPSTAPCRERRSCAVRSRRSGGRFRMRISR